MYKKILFICCIFLLSGCTRISNDNQYIDLVNHCLVEKKITNDVALGYKYYIPRGVEKIHDYDYNQEFLVDNTSIYLYVDIVSYYYKKELQGILRLISWVMSIFFLWYIIILRLRYILMKKI